MSKKLNDAQKREKIDPNEDTKPLPWFITMTIGALISWSCFYIKDTVMLDPSWLGDSRSHQVASLECASSDTAKAASAIDGGAIFQAKCVACHQANGQGIPGVFPPLAGSEWVKGKPEVLASIVLHGVSGKLHVKGTEYNGQMPLFKDVLKDDEIAGVLTHIRAEWGNASPAVDEKLVSSVRKSTESRTQPYDGDDELSKL